jgi:Plasmid replication region DNA-binding N-term
MPKITDTYANAYACCEQVLIETGRFPTIDAIRTRIGVNSPNTINNAIKAWTQDFAEKQLDKQSRPDIPLTLLNSIEQIWKLASIEAAKNFADKENTLKASVLELQNTADQQQSLLMQVKQQLEVLSRQNEQNMAKIEAITLINTEITQENKAQQEHIATLDTQLLNKDAQLVEQENKWLERQEQDQQWFARRLLEEKTFMEQTWRDKSQRQLETIQSLTLSEESLRQTCVSLSRDHKKVMEELKTLQNATEKKRFGSAKNKRFPKAF